MVYIDTAAKNREGWFTLSENKKVAHLRHPGAGSWQYLEEFVRSRFVLVLTWDTKAVVSPPCPAVCVPLFIFFNRESWILIFFFSLHFSKNQDHNVFPSGLCRTYTTGEKHGCKLQTEKSENNI